MILTHKGVRYELSVKRRVNTMARRSNISRPIVTGRYRAAGFGRGYASHSARHTFATRLLAQGHPIETVQLLLGHSSIDHVAPYLEVSKKARRHAMADLGGVFEED